MQMKIMPKKKEKKKKDILEPMKNSYHNMN